MWRDAHRLNSCRNRHCAKCQGLARGKAAADKPSFSRAIPRRVHAAAGGPRSLQNKGEPSDANARDALNIADDPSISAQSWLTVRKAIAHPGRIPKAARVEFTCWLLIGGQQAWRELILWTCGGGGGFGAVLPLGGQDVHGQRRERCEVVAAPTRRRQSGGAEDGRPQALPCGAREGLGSFADCREAGSHAALLKELADCGLVVSYYALWHFLQHEGVTFRKKPSRLRTGPAGRRQAA